LPNETRLLFHDSEVRRITADAGAATLEIHFSAARVRESGAQGDDDAYLGGVTLALSQARWTGPVACQDPRYDNWGGPPGNPFGGAQPTAAKGLASAPRGKVVLKREVRSPVPLLGIAGQPPPRRAKPK